MNAFVRQLKQVLGQLWDRLCHLEVDGPSPRHEKYPLNEIEQLDQLKDRIRYQTDRYVRGRNWP